MRVSVLREGRDALRRSQTNDQLRRIVRMIKVCALATRLAELAVAFAHQG